MTKEERDAIIERCAAVVDQCNREGPYEAIGAAKRIRALKDEAMPEGFLCPGKLNNETCTLHINPSKCLICGFVPDWRKRAVAAING